MDKNMLIFRFYISGSKVMLFTSSNGSLDLLPVFPGRLGYLFFLFSTDPRSSQSSVGTHSFFGDLENEADIKDGECAHVPGLKKKK